MVEEGALFSKQLNIFHSNTIVESLSLSLPPPRALTSIICLVYIRNTV